jgi:hypothetical protein
MPMQHGEKYVPENVGPKPDGPKGIENKNESLERPDETKRQGAVRKSAIDKLERDLQLEHPDWPDDQVRTVATRMFELALSKPVSGRASGEGGTTDAIPKEAEMKPAAPAPEYYNDSGETGVTQMPSTPKGLRE